MYQSGTQPTGMDSAMMPSQHYYWPPPISVSMTSPSTDIVMHHTHQFQPSSNGYLTSYVPIGIPPTFHPRPPLADLQGRPIFSYPPVCTQLAEYPGMTVSSNPDYVVQPTPGFPTPSPWKSMIHNVVSPRSAFSGVVPQLLMHTTGGYYNEVMVLLSQMVFSPTMIQHISDLPSSFHESPLDGVGGLSTAWISPTSIGLGNGDPIPFFPDIEAPQPGYLSSPPMSVVMVPSSCTEWPCLNPHDLDAPSISPGHSPSPHVPSQVPYYMPDQGPQGNGGMIQQIHYHYPSTTGYFPHTVKEKDFTLSKWDPSTTKYSKFYSKLAMALYKYNMEALLSATATTPEFGLQSQKLAVELYEKLLGSALAPFNSLEAHSYYLHQGFGIEMLHVLWHNLIHYHLNELINYRTKCIIYNYPQLKTLMILSMK